MKIAYLFIAHNHPALLAGTIAKLNSENALFYIHIDLKSDQVLFAKALLGIDAKIEFVQARQSIYWMGYSMVAASLELMRLARASTLEAAIHVDYFVLLSGMDYPIKTNKEIERTLSESRGTNYLMFWRLEDLPDWLHKVQQYHYLNSKWHNQRVAHVFFGKVQLPFHRVERIRRFLHRFLPKRQVPRDLVPYGGSQWWMLTSEAVEYTLDFLENAPEVETFFRFTHSPDELVMQTILMNSPFRDSIHGREHYDRFIDAWKNDGDADFVTDRARNFNLRFIDWEPNREFPSVLDERDYQAIKTSACLFARKFDPVRSQKLIELINQGHDANCLS